MKKEKKKKLFELTKRLTLTQSKRNGLNYRGLPLSFAKTNLGILACARKFFGPLGQVELRV
jgi:hypothetical protein